MRPNWKKLVGGLLGVILVFVLLVIFDRKGSVGGFVLGLAKNPYQFAVFNVAFLSVCSALGFLLSKRKGRNPLGWTVACFLLHVYGLIYLWSLPELPVGLGRRRAGSRDKSNPGQ